jgi:hypothetical protein
LSHRIEKRPFQNLGGATKSERIYVDFLIDGEPLSEILETREMDMIGAIGISEHLDFELRMIKEFRLTTPPMLDNGRTIIYGCAECLDIGCGAITAGIEEKDGRIVWSRFAYENGYAETDFEEYGQLGPYQFDSKQYHEELKKIENVVQQGV